VWYPPHDAELLYINVISGALQVHVSQTHKSGLTAVENDTMYRVFKKNFTTVFHMILCGEFYEKVYT
jgi:hypothetical protein